jgi:predicted Rossmann fold nucleotide-binding protein DprA/Smf involved in DNA uptake
LAKGHDDFQGSWELTEARYVAVVGTRDPTSDAWSGGQRLAGDHGPDAA